MSVRGPGLPARTPLARCVLAILIATASSTGCENGAEKSVVAPAPSSLTSRSSSTPSPSLTTPSPSLTYEDGRGRAIAIGTLVYRRDRGGFFAVADLVPGAEPSPAARLIAVLVNPDGSRDAPDLISLVGSYCTFRGAIRDETSASAVPELVLESYAIVATPAEP